MNSSMQSGAMTIGRRILGRVRRRLRVRTRVKSIAREIVIWARPKGPAPAIVAKDNATSTVVDDYWNRHTVHSGRFISARESEEYLGKRISEYPMFIELMDLYGDHTGETVLDYGCGPGDDTTGFLLWSNASKVIGMDVSQKALGFLRHRLALHRVDRNRVELVKITDSAPKIPLPDASVDWVHCCGVLHHTTHPQEILNEFGRVMKPGVEGRLMLYNRDSVFYHLWLAYAQLIVNNAFPGLTIDAAFTKSTDGPNCPVSDAWTSTHVLDMIKTAGLEGTFRGGYISIMEIGWLKDYGKRAVTDPRLADEHRQFVSELQFDQRGYPMWRDKYAGVGGIYTVKKPGVVPA
jgi:ubiquinone/menaquinone biosynthesis C-methylase UbiE